MDSALLGPSVKKVSLSLFFNLNLIYFMVNCVYYNRERD